MKSILMLGGAAFALLSAPAASAQQAQPSRPAPAERSADPHAGHDMSSADAVPGQPDDPNMEHMGHHMAPAASAQFMGHGGHNMSDMGAGHSMSNMAGALGSYPAARESSGTSWQPETVSSHGGPHVMRGGWMLMGHAMFNGVYDWQEGPRGDEKAFVSGMVMGVARGDMATGDVLNLRAMLSPDPFMGASGYPLLLAAGETADGEHTLVDRQHPHDLFMELSASYSHRLSDKASVFGYVGLPGEPAFGPPAFMHRLSAMDSPEAPITHHWLDSTHIVFGVATAGVVYDNWKVEASRFKGREPDQHRYVIEAPEFDSTALRVSWNPTSRLSLQGSWADLKSPEQLEPEIDERRWSASAIYTVPFANGGWWSTTAAWGRKDRRDGATLDGLALESAVKPNDAWTVFARLEHIQTDELGEDGHDGAVHGEVENVAKASIGAIHDWRVGDSVKLGLGALISKNWVSDELEPSYGGDPGGAMAFIRLKLG